jgi:hypothetical protein
MIDSPELLIEVIGIEPEAVYKKTVYDQTVIAHLQDGTEIELFDKTMPTIEKDMIGDTVNICVHIQPATSVTKIEDISIGINSSTDSSSKWNYDFVGRILDIDLDSRSVLFDIGIGTISIIYYDNEVGRLIESDEITVGYHLYISNCREDIIRVNNIL